MIFKLIFFFLENDSFDLEMEDYFAPPPILSQSAPELNVTMPEPPMIRFSVSSTELLYERAMARFYKAVEYEETENARKRSISVEQESRRRSFSFDQEGKRLSIQADPQDAALTRLRINSLTGSEKSSVLRRRLSGEGPNLQITIPRRLSFKDEDPDDSDRTQLNTLRNELNTPEMYDRSPSPLAPPLAEGEALSDDYTDSTASSEDENANVTTRRSRQRTNEMPTYHPRMLSPYRQPENSEAAAVLTKPLPPLPDPNFVPKPILKRPASADGRKPAPNKPERKTISSLFGGRRSASPSPVPSPRSQRKSVEIDEIPQIIQLGEFRKFERSPEKSALDVPEIKVQAPKPQEVKEVEQEFEPEPEILFRRSDQAKLKMMERRQSSLEENRVMADFYGDIIKDHSVRPIKPKVPIYMDPEALKALELEDDDATNDSGITSSADMSPQSTLNRPFSPSIVQSPIQTRELSPSLIARRASESLKPRTFSPPPSNESDFVFGRRLSDTNKVKLLSNLPLKDKPNTLSKPTSDRSELNKSPSPQKTLPTNGSVLLKHEVTVSSTSSIDDPQSRGRGNVAKPKTGTIPKRRNQSHSRSRDTSTTRGDLPTIARNPADSTILARRDKSSSKTRNRSESKSPSTMNRKVIINRVASPKLAPKVVTPASMSPVSSRTATPSEMQEQVQLQVKSTMTHVTDVAILLFATYVYFFKSAILALPILVLLVYRQIADKIPDWMKRKKS